MNLRSSDMGFQTVQDLTFGLFGVIMMLMILGTFLIWTLPTSPRFRSSWDVFSSTHDDLDEQPEAKHPDNTSILTAEFQDAKMDAFSNKLKQQNMRNKINRLQTGAKLKKLHHSARANNEQKMCVKE